VPPNSEGPIGREVLTAPPEPEIFETLCCPETTIPLAMMTNQELERLNETIERGLAGYACGAQAAGTLEWAGHRRRNLRGGLAQNPHILP